MDIMDSIFRLRREYLGRFRMAPDILLITPDDFDLLMAQEAIKLRLMPGPYNRRTIMGMKVIVTSAVSETKVALAGE